MASWRYLVGSTPSSSQGSWLNPSLMVAQADCRWVFATRGLALSSSMFLDCFVSLNASLQDHDPLSWISSFSCHRPSLFGDSSPQMEEGGDWIPDMHHRWCKSWLPSVRINSELHSRMWNGGRRSKALSWCHCLVSNNMYPLLGTNP